MNTGTQPCKLPITQNEVEEEEKRGKVTNLKPFTPMNTSTHPCKLPITQNEVEGEEEEREKVNNSRAFALES